jgi:RimJ/RimL family protein N-acetyltransferase
MEVHNSGHFPAVLLDEVRAERVEPSLFWSTVAAVPSEEQPFAHSFVELGNYERPPERAAQSQELRARHQQMHQEYILMLDGERCVGWSQGGMRDAETFYMAYSGVVRSQQRRGIYSAFVRAYLPYLRSLGYERVVSHHMVNNRAILIAKLKLGFIISGVLLDERYGAQAVLSYLFHEDRRAGFAKAFSLEPYEATLHTLASG